MYTCRIDLGCAGLSDFPPPGNRKQSLAQIDACDRIKADWGHLVIVLAVFSPAINDTLGILSKTFTALCR